jgi:hypothetical protein
MCYFIILMEDKMSNSSNKAPIRAKKIPQPQANVTKPIVSATPQAKVVSTPIPAATTPAATTNKTATTATSAPKANAKPASSVITTNKTVAKAAAPKKKATVKKAAKKTVKKVTPKPKTTAKKSVSVDSWDWASSWEWGNYNLDFIPMEEHTKQYESVIDTNKKLLKALEESSQTAFKGYNDIMKLSLSFATTSIDKILEMCSSFANSNDPAETLEKTLKSLHKELENVMVHQNKVSDASIKSAHEITKPISSHIDSSIKNVLGNIPKIY